MSGTKYGLCDASTSGRFLRRFVVSGEVSLSELVQETGLKIRKEDEESFDTLNGLLISLLDHIPQDDEVFSVEYEGFCFDSVATKARMTHKIVIRILIPHAALGGSNRNEKRCPLRFNLIVLRQCLLLP